LPDEASTGETLQRLANEALLPSLWGVVSRHDQERSRVVRTYARSGDKLGSGLSYQTTELSVEVGDLPGQHCSRGGLGISRVGLPLAPKVSTLRSLDLEHPYPRGSQVTGEPGAVAARALHPGAPHAAEAFRPGDEALVALLGRRHAELS
jgi:hypothetical protein